MKTDLLKQTEIFVFLALVFSIFVASLVADKKKLLSDKEMLISKGYNATTPPHIIISDANSSYFFKSGSAMAPDGLKRHIRTNIIPKLHNNLEQCPTCNTIYIIGHTDHQSVSSENEITKFDNDLVKALSSDCYIGNNISFSSNTDLGLLRASAIYCELKKDNTLRDKIKYWHPYSAGPIIDTNKKIVSFIDGKDDPKRRRIEIRLFYFSD